MVELDRVGRVPARSPPRPRRCWPSRTSSSSTSRASTSGCATTSPIRSSRSRWTRTSRASTSRASATAATALYFGPYSNAKRMRSTLDAARQGLPVPLLPGRRSPGRRTGSPCLDYYIKRCGAPCVGYVTREEYRESIDGVIAFLSGRYREIERDLERRMSEAAAAQEFEQAALERNRLQRGALAARAPARRQRVGRHARRGRRRRRRHRRQRAGLPGPRRRALRPPVVLPRRTRPSASEARWSRSSCCSTTATRCRSRRRSSSRTSSRTRGAGRGARRAPRRARRGARGRARRQAPDPRARRAQREARARPGAPEGRAPPPAARRGARRAAGGARPRRAAAADRVLRHLEPDGHAHDRRRWSSSRAARRRSPTTGASTSAGCEEGVPDDFAAMEEVLARRLAQWERQQDLSPARPQAQRVVRDAAEPDRHRRRPGPARRRACARCRASASAASRSSRWPSASRRSSSRARARRSCCAHDTPALQLLQRVRDEAHRFAITHHRTRRDQAMTESMLDDLPGIGPDAQARAAQALRLARGGARGLARGARGGARAARRRPRASSTRTCTAPAGETARPE